MNRKLFIEFQQHSQDYLRLLGEKSRRAARSKQDADELSVMEFFWDGVDEIFKKYEDELHSLRLQALNEKIKGHLLQSELKNVYNELYLVTKSKQTLPEAFAKFLAKTVMPTAEDLKKDINIRMNGGT